MATIKCPICDKTFDQRQSDAMPFCGKRCQQIDLSRWFNESYSVPYVCVEDEVDDVLEPHDER